MSRRQCEEWFRQFAEWGFNERGWSTATRLKYRQRVKAADEWLGEHRKTSVFYAKPKDIKAYLFVYGGLRREEVRTLEWRHKDRVLPLHPRAREALTRWQTHCPDPQWVFPSPQRVKRGRPMSHSKVHMTVVRIGELAQVKEIHAHMFRHTFATRMLQKGADLREVQEALGHASPTTTAIYTHVMPTQLRAAIERIDYRAEDAEDADGCALWPLEVRDGRCGAGVAGWRGRLRDGCPMSGHSMSRFEEEGDAARRRGEPESANPYPGVPQDGAYPSVYWSIGWRGADRELRKAAGEDVEQWG